MLHIVPDTGVDRVLLGMDRTEARLILGEPDSVQLLDVDPVTADSIIWCYDDPYVELAFDEDAQFKLTRITVRDPAAVLLGVQPIGLLDSEIGNHFPKARLTFSVCEMQEFTDEQLDISLWTRHGRVVSVTLSPRYVVDDNIPIWPEFR